MTLSLFPKDKIARCIIRIEKIYRMASYTDNSTNVDKFGKELAIGDRIIVCFDKDGWLSRATIIGESEKKWIIEEEAYYNPEIIHKRRMDKNPRRIIKYGN